MEKTPYQLLAERLDALPNGFPPTPDGVELRILAKLFTPGEAALASRLRMTLESPDQIAGRIGGDPAELRLQLKALSRRGLIAAGPVEGGLGFGLMPFVVGFYEMQGPTMDAELASLFEGYFQQTLGKALAIEPPVHRVIPINESIPVGLEVRPFESAAEIVEAAQSWGVTDCICRKQKNLIGQGCSHSLDVCLTLSAKPGAFDRASAVRVLTKQEAMQTLRRSAEEGLVHSVSNKQEDLWYICNCCTCSCGVLRGMVELGLANVVAKSAFVNRVDDGLCVLCGDCVERCQFGAIALNGSLTINQARCTGCGVCTIACQEGALHLELRPEADIPIPPESEMEWQAARAKSRQIDLDAVR